MQTKTAGLPQKPGRRVFSIYLAKLTVAAATAVAGHFNLLLHHVANLHLDLVLLHVWNAHSVSDGLRLGLALHVAHRVFPGSRFRLAHRVAHFPLLLLAHHAADLVFAGALFRTRLA